MAAMDNALRTETNPVRAKSWYAARLPMLMLAGLFLGCLIGWLWPAFAINLQPISQAFIKALRLMVMPLIFSSITLGVYKMGRELSVLGRVVGIAFIWFYLATGLCICIGLVMNELFHPGIGADLSLVGKVPANAGLKIDWAQFLLDLIPTNIIGAMAEQKVLQVLLFGIVFGAALSQIGETALSVVAVLDAIQTTVLKMVRWVLALAPVAVAAIMAWLVASQGLKTLLALAKLVMTLYIGLAVVVILLWLALYLIGLNPFVVTRKVSEPLLLGFTTRSSETTLPVIMEILEKEGVPNRIVSTVIPLGYSFNQDGITLYVSLAVAFVVEAHHITLDWHSMLTIGITSLIATKGTGNVGGGGIVAATTVLVGMGLPVDSVAIIAGVDIFMDMGRTAVNVLGNTVACLVVQRLSGVKDEVPAGALPTS